MEPAIGESVLKLSERSYRVGSSMVCELSEAGPRDVLASWQEGENTFIVRKASEQERQSSTNSSSIVTPWYTLAKSEGLWGFGGTVQCRSKAWAEGLEPEGETISFVKMHCPTIPVPEVIFSWIDHEWNRAFTICKRPEGTELGDRWPSLSESQKIAIVHQVLGYCHELAQLTSSRFETATGKGIVDSYLDTDNPPDHPIWKPRMLGPMSGSELTDFFRRRRSDQATQDMAPPCGDTLYYHNALLVPSSIHISQDAKVTCILNWELAGFFPRWYIALRPRIAWGFTVSRGPIGGKDYPDIYWEYARYLHRALKEGGFEFKIETLEWFWTLK